MERRDFLASTALASLFMGGPLLASAAQPLPGADPLQPFYVPPAEPLTPGPTGLNIRTRVRHGQTNGQFSCVEFAVAPKKMGPAPHLHKDLDELMFVLEGTAMVLVGDTEYQVQAGGWHLRPRGIVHTFWNATDKPVVAIDCYFQQPFEEYLEASTKTIPELAKSRGLAMNAPEIQAMYRDLHQKFGMVSFPEKRQAIVDKYQLR
ncbi:cupin 2, barrel [Fibrella aestuarina BUZ 2]|uniref:Cupin 2, barrel n=1 Tax=Fibrella aestuarina BUZ 2 TaxID=1166018 RepID=I0K6F6_9BACT|nr:cupin domain-containing protein [Fibrella aestuarina]CCG99709.1 cupin 2, barrel [Fibrella aestuarina BUZ 2]